MSGGLKYHVRFTLGMLGQRLMRVKTRMDVHELNRTVNAVNGWVDVSMKPPGLVAWVKNWVW